ncbi:MAG TPA: alpha/beta fold hydrolase, partial [Roseiflexaceae bacterium]
MRVRVNDIELQVELAGASRPLLLLHGFSGGAATWDAHIPRLAPHARTIAVDLIGHGRSDAPEDAGRYRIERCVADLLAVLDALGVERADVLGYSMGGRVALHLAAAAPARLDRLVLESSSPG